MLGSPLNDSYMSNMEKMKNYHIKSFNKVFDYPDENKN